MIRIQVSERKRGRLLIQAFGVVMMLSGANVYGRGGWPEVLGVIAVTLAVWQLAFIGLDVLEKRRS